MEKNIEIRSREFWVKIIEMLQQNWAIVEQIRVERCKVYFISDTSGVFDELEFHSKSEAFEALRKNGFFQYANDKNIQNFIIPPNPPFHRSSHPNGKIYSSGRFWK
jgi:hypothetical protein